MPAAAADLLGYPAVVKLRDTAAPADRLPGSLVFDLHDASQLSRPPRNCCRRAGRAATAGLGELLVQRHAGRGRELAIRVSDDADIRTDDLRSAPAARRPIRPTLRSICRH